MYTEWEEVQARTGHPSIAAMTGGDGWAGDAVVAGWEGDLGDPVTLPDSSATGDRPPWPASCPAGSRSSLTTPMTLTPKGLATRGGAPATRWAEVREACSRSRPGGTQVDTVSAQLAQLTQLAQLV